MKTGVLGVMYLADYVMVKYIQENLEAIAAIIGAVTVIAGAFIAICKFVKSLKSKKHDFFTQYRAMRKRFFYDEEIVSKFLLSYGHSKIKNTQFIHYKEALDGVFYHNAGIDIKLRADGTEKTLRFPYEECINFIKNTEAKVIVDSVMIPVVSPSGEYLDNTNINLEAYLKYSSITYNDRILCMKELHKAGDGVYKCRLASAEFYDIIRTNLTLDYPLENMHGEVTLRRLEMASAGGGLSALDKSGLMNPVGVSAIWCMDRGKGCGKDRYNYFLKCRQSDLSVYSGMLGTVSGYVDTPDSFRLESDNLMTYMESEILREFQEETRYGDYAKSKGFEINDNRYVKVIPLAFTRELIRGGIPQFFFMIITPYLSKSEFVRYFKSSEDGLFEFKDDKLANLKTHQLSPETALNLFYCKQYVQRALGNDYIYL